MEEHAFVVKVGTAYRIVLPEHVRSWHNIEVDDYIALRVLGVGKTPEAALRRAIEKG